MSPVLVVGAGTMGAGIAQLCAQAGLQVTLTDIDPGQLQAAEATIRASLHKLAAKGRIALDPGAVVAAIQFAHTPEGELPSAAYHAAIEAVPEEIELKLGVLRQLERACPAHALLASNTSGIPITRLAAALEHPQRLVGLHFFNPVVLMRAVEVIRGEASSVLAFDAAVELVHALGKEPLRVREDIPGFVLNRISMVASNEAMRLVERGVASAQEIDRGVRGAFGWKMGPLETADLVGLDVVLAARDAIFRQTGDPRFEPPPILRQLVAQGRLGRKSGGGFYDHED